MVYTLILRYLETTNLKSTTSSNDNISILLVMINEIISNELPFLTTRFDITDTRIESSEESEKYRLLYILQLQLYDGATIYDNSLREVVG